MLMALRGILVSLLGVYYFTFFKDYNNVKKSNKLDKAIGVLKSLFIALKNSSLNNSKSSPSTFPSGKLSSVNLSMMILPVF